jgi:hypothetical protein
VEITAKVILWDSDRHFRLPGTGTRSMLVRFGDGASAVSFGTWAVDDNGEAFSPGTAHDVVRLSIWSDPEARRVVAEGAEFVVWYGADVGRGSVTSIP